MKSFWMSRLGQLGSCGRGHVDDACTQRVAKCRIGATTSRCEVYTLLRAIVEIHVYCYTQKENSGACRFPCFAGTYPEDHEKVCARTDQEIRPPSGLTFHDC